MSSIAAISQCFSQLKSIFSQVCLIANRLALLFSRVDLRDPRQARGCVPQVSVGFDEIRLSSISSNSEGCYTAAGKALKSDVTPKEKKKKRKKKT